MSGSRWCCVLVPSASEAVTRSRISTRTSFGRDWISIN
jgi:hypothetical protein